MNKGRSEVTFVFGATRIDTYRVGLLPQYLLPDGMVCSIESVIPCFTGLVQKKYMICVR